MTVVITNWTGRLGNNIIQILQAIHYAIHHHHKFILIPKHSFLIHQHIQLPFDKNSNIVKNQFFNRTKIPNFPPINLHKMKQYFMQYCRHLLPPKLQNIPFNNSICIHIRSGDTFSSNPHPAYLPPPISFYLESIKKSQNKQIVIVYEDNKNPSVNKLKQLLPQAKFQSSSLIDDIYTLCQSQHLAFGPGTFGLLIYFISPHIQHLYTPDFNQYSDLVPFHSETTLHSIPIHNYIKNGEWKNTSQQQLLILNR